MFDFLVPKSLQVTFQDDPPQYFVDRTLFDQARFRTISQEGLRICKLGLILDASVHYQSRHRRRPSLRYCNALLDLVQSLPLVRNGDEMVFGGDESNEFQAQSSEVIAVGVCVALCRRLFRIKRNRIRTIEATSTRLDFEFEKDGLTYAVESRGRKNGLKAAIRGIYNKKQAAARQCNYGFVTHIPRDGTPAAAIVVDPEGPAPAMLRHELVRGLLLHYARLATLCGLWRLADLLYERSDLIIDDESLERLDRDRLNYGQIRKFGRAFEFQFHQQHRTFFFDPRGDVGFHQHFGDGRYVAFFAMDPLVIDILEAQDYQDLIEFGMGDIPEDPVEMDNGWFLSRDDGSTLGIVRSENAPWLVT